MNKKELRILENADSHLHEALAQYQHGKQGNSTAYRFCIHHVIQFMELVFRYYILLIHPLLIYKNPFANSIDSESRTIEFEDIVNFLKNEDITDKFLKDLQWFRHLALSMQYYEFDFTDNFVDETVGRLIHATIEFDETHQHIDLSEFIVSENLERFHELADRYEKRLKTAMEEVENSARHFLENQKAGDSSNFQVFHCEECHHDTIAPNTDSSTGFKCTFCGNEFSREIEIECSVCGISWGIEEMNRYEENDQFAYICPRCSNLPESQTV